MRTCIVNVFQEEAFLLCEQFLNEGAEVISIDDRPLLELTEQEEDLWLCIGRNANLSYQTKSGFIEAPKIPEKIKAVYYFVRDDRSEERNQSDKKLLHHFQSYGEDQNVEFFLVRKESSANLSSEDKTLFKKWKEILIKEKEEWVQLIEKIVSQFLRSSN